MIMKRILALAIAICLLAACHPTTYNTYATISGFVYDKTDGSQIKNAVVTLSPSGKNAFTGSDGFFQFNDLDPTRYTLTVQKEGYESDIVSLTVYAGETETISITLKRKD